MTSQTKPIDGFEQAKAAAEALIEPFRPVHPRLKVFIGFEVTPQSWLDCNHAETPEEALQSAKAQDQQTRRRTR